VRLKRRQRFDRERYADRVAALLQDEFGWDETTVRICRHAILRNPEGIGDHFELICDMPGIANWRLKNGDWRGGPWLLRMSYYGDNPANLARQDRITRELFLAHQASSG
jgi:hypothetical protein